jgi:hemoglobin
MKKQLLQLSFAGMLFASILTGCKKDETMPASLYERLGGVNAISAVVDKFLANVVADNRINGFFAATVQSPSRTQLLRNNLIDQIGEAAGGPLKYKGKDMVTAHTGMNITDAQFNALVEDLVAALNHFMVPSTEQNELLTVLGGLKPQIVGK